MNDDPAAESILESGSGLEQISAFLRGARWRQGEEHGLTPTQIQLLELLHRRGGQRVAALARHLGVTQATASDSLTALTRKGLAERLPDPTDGRATQAEATARGRDLLARIERFPPALLEALRSLAPQEQSALRRVLVLLVRALQESGEIEPQRLCVTCRHFRPYAHKDAARPHHCAFVDAAFGDAALRLDCGDHVEADATERRRSKDRFAAGPPA